MAERITEPIDWGSNGRVPTPHPKAYPWEEWIDGSVWKIYRHADYRSKTVSMANMLQRAARERGMKVRLLVDRDPMDPNHKESVTFQFYRP